MLSLAVASLAATSPVEDVATSVGRGGDHWAVLVAGSNTYGNYRHQADVCHAYQLLKAAGIKEEQIITLAYDDIANNSENPYPGKIFNKPTAAGTPGTDVYAGCKIDYSGKDVTPEMFTAVLTGDTSVATGKVLQSTQDSRVFVNFVDHGGTGIIAFPSGASTMHSTELIKALTTMHDNKMYKELVFYLEACESGSMFQDLPTDLNIYATTASNAKESSWGTYCPGQSPGSSVDGKDIGSCLGDLYSVNWMEDSDASLGSSETIGEQFDKVVATTTKSHVTEFGTTALKSEATSNFQGKTDAVAGMLGMTHRTNTMVEEADAAWVALRAEGAVRMRDAEIASAYHRYMKGSAAAGKELVAAVEDRAQAKARFEKIGVAVAGRATTGEYRAPRVDMQCHFKAHKAYTSKCGAWTTGSLAYSAHLAELCEHTSGDERAIVAAITEACASQ